jgi:nascent polypeptide-associated complex subunit alpha
MMGRMNPKQMERMMRKMGLQMEEVKDAKRVVIETETKEIIIDNPSITIMNVQGEKTFQIQGSTSEKTLKEEIPQEDIELVMAQTGVDEAAAKKALEDAGGEPAEAIINLMG